MTDRPPCAWCGQPFREHAAVPQGLVPLFTCPGGRGFYTASMGLALLQGIVKHLPPILADTQRVVKAPAPSRKPEK